MGTELTVEPAGCDRHGPDALLEQHGRKWVCISCTDKTEGTPAPIVLPSTRTWPLYEITYGGRIPSHQEIVQATSNRVLDHSRNCCTCWSQA